VCNIPIELTEEQANALVAIYRESIQPAHADGTSAGHAHKPQAQDQLIVYKQEDVRGSHECNNDSLDREGAMTNGARDTKFRLQQLDLEERERALNDRERKYNTMLAKRDDANIEEDEDESAYEDASDEDAFETAIDDKLKYVINDAINTKLRVRAVYDATNKCKEKVLRKLTAKCARAATSHAEVDALLQKLMNMNV
jgi:hypothetical protein